MNPWSKARTRVLKRASGCSGKPIKLDRGVNYFIMALEELGCETYHSCDGHGFAERFYIMFRVPRYEVAERIAAVGYFRVELQGDPPKTFRLGLGRSWDIKKVKGYQNRYRSVPIKTAKGRKKAWSQTLRWAAEAWEKKLFGRGDGPTHRGKKA